MKEDEQRDALNYIWHKGVVRWGMPLAILCLLAIVAFAMFGGDWSGINGMLVLQVLLFWGVIGFCIGMYRDWRRRQQ